jgi:hypothetical protein
MIVLPYNKIFHIIPYSIKLEYNMFNLTQGFLMKKLTLSSLLLGAAMFMAAGTVSLNGADMKYGAGKCGKAMQKPAGKCGKGKKDGTGKGAGKCGMNKKDGTGKNSAKCGNGKKDGTGKGVGKCGMNKKDGTGKCGNAN